MHTLPQADLFLLWWELFSYSRVSPWELTGMKSSFVYHPQVQTLLTNVYFCVFSIQQWGRLMDSEDGGGGETGKENSGAGFTSFSCAGS